MRFFNIDFHISVIADLVGIFGDLGHTVDDVCLSGHHSIMGRKQDYIPLLSGEYWKDRVKQWDWDKFYHQYRYLDAYDGFIVTWPPVLAMAFEKFNKPIIIHTPIRYDTGLTNLPEQWKLFNKFLKDYPKLILTANNKYDAAYIKEFTGINLIHIPSFCGYTGINYLNINQKNGKYLGYFSDNKTEGLSEFIDKRSLPFGYPWKILESFKGVAHLPYQVSTMSLFEQYTANIPLFFPTKEFLKKMYEDGSHLLHQVSNNQLESLPPVSTISPMNGIDPNNYTDKNVINFWLNHADYYDQEWMPHINYFNAPDELQEITSKLSERQLYNISLKMSESNTTRKKEIYQRWNQVLTA